MPYDYYEFLKQQQNSEEYTQVSDIVRQTLWSESISFNLMLSWLNIEEKIRIKLYPYLRYN